MAAAVPWIAGAAGSLISGVQAKHAADQNAALMEQQGRIAQAQAFRDEETQRRQARQMLGTQAAAIAESGGGMGGTSAKLIEQSAANAELDALNIRYAGILKGKGLMAAGANQKELGGNALTQSYFLAGSNLLRGYGAAKAA